MRILPCSLLRKGSWGDGAAAADGTLQLMSDSDTNVNR